MKISVITPSFNQGEFLEATIQSVLSQNYPELEYIVVDGGSTDNTIDILKKYEDRLTWISEKDGGQSDAINKGIKMATGDIIAYICSDDLYLEGTLFEVFNFFNLNKSAMWVTGDYYIIDEHNNRIHSFVKLYKQILRIFPNFFMLAFANFINQPSTFWRREVFEEIGLFDVSLNYVMDYDFFIRLMKKYPLYKINLPLSDFRIHKSSKGGALYYDQFKEEIEVLQRYTNNSLLILLHRLHNLLIVYIYKYIK